jgi:opacity protein-like surface antigen
MLLVPLAATSAVLAQAAVPAGAADARPKAATVSTASWYLRNEVGGNLIPSISLADRSTTDGVNVVSISGATLSMDAGVAWNIAFGWKMNDMLGIEVSSGISYNSFDYVTGTVDLNGTAETGSVGVDGSLLQVPILAGPRLELPVGDSLRINLGASVGAICLHGQLDSTFNTGAGSFTLDGSDTSWAFAYSATFGLDWAVAPSVGVGVAYRFLGTTSAGFAEGDFIEADAIYNQQVMATVTLRF